MSEAFWSHWTWPFATAILVTIFTFLVFNQYLKRRKLHQLHWSIGFFLFAVAAYMEALSEFAGNWEPFIYRLYIVSAASLVGFLGLGTLYLISKKKIYGHIGLVYFLTVSIVFLVGSLTASLDLEQLRPGITVGGKALGPSLSFPRVCSLFINIPGTLLLLGGALYSIAKFTGKKEWSYRVWANVWIATGTIVIAWAGSKARLGSTAGLYPAEMIGASLLLVGFLKAGTLERGVKAIKEKSLKKEHI